MPTPSKSEIFTTLNAYRIKSDNQLSLFSETCADNIANESWLYSDLHNLYGETKFPTKPSFSAHIWQNMVTPSASNSKRGFPELNPVNIDFYDQHVAQITHPYTLGQHRYKNAKDFKLSRYACWCMSRNNPNMIFSRTYFISPIINPTMDFETMEKLSYQFARVYLRDKLSKYEKKINGIAYKHHINFNEFRNCNRAALFGDHNKAHIAERRDFYISPRTPLADHMGAATLYARTNALHNAIQRINSIQRIRPDQIFEIIFTELNTARTQMITTQNIHPENDISCTPAPQIKSQLMRTERDFINKYAFQKLR